MCRADDSFKMFVISPGARDARDWARRFWDTYGFDYDAERSTDEVVYAWAHGDQTDEGLAQELEEDNVEFSTRTESNAGWFDVCHVQMRS